jgi:uncharacterized membrane protein
MTNNPVELHHGDFDEWGRELVWMAGEHLVSQARDLIDRMDQAVRQARRHLAQAERPARLTALRRVRAAGRTEQERDR